MDWESGTSIGSSDQNVQFRCGIIVSCCVCSRLLPDIMYTDQRHAASSNREKTPMTRTHACLKMWSPLSSQSNPIDACTHLERKEPLQLLAAATLALRTGCLLREQVWKKPKSVDDK